MELKGKTCIVSGAAGGIGYAVSEQYAKNGANVVMIDNDEVALAEAVENVKALGADVLPLKADLASTLEIKKVMEKVENTYGAVNILANCVGISFNADVLDFAEEDWDLVLNINLKGVFFISQAVAQNMVKHNVKNGKIISISSQAGIVGEPGCHAYGASKAGVSMLTQTMALDLAPHGICCSAVAPGTINTDMIQGFFERASAMEGIPKKEFEEVRMESIPLKRMGEPEEVADLIYFLSSDKANYLTGSTYNVTGGSMNL